MLNLSHLQNHPTFQSELLNVAAKFEIFTSIGSPQQSIHVHHYISYETPYKVGH